MWLRNPILAREIGLITRNGRVHMVLAACAAVVGSAAILYLAAAARGQSGGGLPLPAGANLFGLVTTLQMAVIILVAPGLTAGSLSAERERATMEPLLQTGLPATVLVLGKLIGAIIYLTLILVAMAPATGILFLMGGIGWAQAAWGLAVCLATGALLAAMSLCISAFSRHTQAAAAAAYALTAVLVVGTALPAWLGNTTLASWGLKPAGFTVLASLNPVAALAATLGGPFFSPVLVAVLGPAAPPALINPALSAAPGLGGGTTPIGAGGFVPPAYVALQQGGTVTTAGSPLLGSVPIVYQTFIGFAFAAALFLTVVAAIGARPPWGRGLRAALGLRPSRRPVADVSA